MTDTVVNLSCGSVAIRTKPSCIAIAGAHPHTTTSHMYNLAMLFLLPRVLMQHTSLYHWWIYFFIEGKKGHYNKPLDCVSL